MPLKKYGALMHSIRYIKVHILLCFVTLGLKNFCVCWEEKKNIITTQLVNALIQITIISVHITFQRHKKEFLGGRRMFDVVNHLIQVCDYMLTGESRSPGRPFVIDSRLSWEEDQSTTNAPISFYRACVMKKHSIFHQSSQNNIFPPVLFSSPPLFIRL